MNNELTNLIKILKLSDEDVLRAVLTVYSPCQPGALKQSWNSRKDYGNAPDGKEIWDIYLKYDFKCVKCQSQYRISIDHIDNDKLNSSIDNLQVLCQKCNRNKQKRGSKNTDVNITVFRELMKIFEDTNEIPTPSQVFKKTTIYNGGSALSTLKFLIHRLKQSKQ